jgi:hypothetical protein
LQKTEQKQHEIGTVTIKERSNLADKNKQKEVVLIHGNRLLFLSSAHETLIKIDQNKNLSTLQEELYNCHLPSSIKIK